MPKRSNKEKRRRRKSIKRGYHESRKYVYRNGRKYKKSAPREIAAVKNRNDGSWNTVYRNGETSYSVPLVIRHPNIASEWKNSMNNQLNQAYLDEDLEEQPIPWRQIRKREMSGRDLRAWMLQDM